MRVSGLSKSNKLVFFDIKKHYDMLCQDCTDRYFDVLIGAYLLNPLKNAYTYDDIAKEYMKEQLPSQEEIFSQVLQHPDVMKFFVKALGEKYGENCMQNFESTAKTATFEVAGQKYRLQLSKVK